MRLQPARFVGVAKTVIAGLLGVRRRAHHDVQTTDVRPLHIIAAGLAAAAVFVLTLVAVVRLVAG